MARFVLSDAAPLICLAQVDGLRWLRTLFGHVHITQEVRDEVLTGVGEPGEDDLLRAIDRRLLRVHAEWDWTDPQFPNLGKGEASCIRTAVNLIKQRHDCLLLIDDLEARRIASSLTLTVTGTAAVVGVAKRTGLIASAGTVFEELLRNGFRISEAVKQGILESVGEEVGAKPGSKTEKPGKRTDSRQRKGPAR